MRRREQNSARGYGYDARDDSHPLVACSSMGYCGSPFEMEKMGNAVGKFDIDDLPYPVTVGNTCHQRGGVPGGVSCNAAHYAIKIGTEKLAGAQKRIGKRYGKEMPVKRIEYIDGLKGLCGIGVFLIHYLLAFAAYGYIGWESGIPVESRASYYFSYFPYSIISNANSPLYLFFAIISFLPAHHYFQSGDNSWLIKQFLTRYFRLMPPVLVSALSAYVVYACGLFFIQEVGNLLSNSWDKSFYTKPLTFFGAVINGVFSAMWTRNGDYCSVLWCMHVILFGSYLTYGILVFWGSLRYRFFVYGGLFLLCFIVPIYTSFLGGIVAADIVVRHPVMKPSRWGGGLFFLTGLVLINFPEVLLPSTLSVYSIYGVGVLFFLLGCSRSSILQKILSHPWLVRAGELSFSLVLIHFTIMTSFSSWFFLKMLAFGLSYETTLVLTFIATVPVIYFFTVLFQRYVEVPTARFTHWGYHLIRTRLGIAV